MVAADLKVTGAFDEAFAVCAGPVIEKLAKELRDVTIDMSEATGGDGAGLRALVYLHKMIEPNGHKVRVLGASGRIQDLFARYHLADLFIEGAAQQGSRALRSCFFGIRPQAKIPVRTAAASSKAEVSANNNGGHLIAGAEAAAEAIRESIQDWLYASTVTGAELRGGDAFKSYRRWAKESAPLVDAGEFRKTLAAILGAGRVIPRTSGYIIRGIKLRPAVKAPRREHAFPVSGIVPRSRIAAPAYFMLGSG
jgi:anti-anti-sigma regulatory factor